MFTTACYIHKDTEELRNKLRELGYLVKDKEIYNYLVVCPDRHITTGHVYSYPSQESIGFEQLKRYYQFIDCDSNEDLFLAIAALRDDNNHYMQWFVCTESYVEKIGGISKEWKIGDFDLYNLDEEYDNPTFPHWRKATVKELIKHFNS